MLLTNNCKNNKKLLIKKIKQHKEMKRLNNQKIKEEKEEDECWTILHFLIKMKKDTEDSFSKQKKNLMKILKQWLVRKQ